MCFILVKLWAVSAYQAGFLILDMFREHKYFIAASKIFLGAKCITFRA